MKKHKFAYPVPAHQADASLSQAGPISGTKYAVLNTTKNARIITVMVKVTWTLQPNPLECHVTIDGQSLTGQKINPVSGTAYYLNTNPANVDTLALSDSLYAVNQAFLFEGRSVKIEVETTGGTVSNLSCVVMYAKW